MGGGMGGGDGEREEERHDDGDGGLTAARWESRGHLKSEMVVATGEFGRRRRFLRTVTTTGQLLLPFFFFPQICNLGV